MGIGKGCVRFKFKSVSCFIFYNSIPLFCFVLIVFRNWKYEQEIAGLLWKVDKADIHASLSGHKNAEFIMDSEKKDAFGSKVKTSLCYKKQIKNPVIPLF